MNFKTFNFNVTSTVVLRVLSLSSFCLNSLCYYVIFSGPEDEDKDKPVRDIDSEDDLIGKVGGILEYL